MLLFYLLQIFLGFTAGIVLGMILKTVFQRGSIVKILITIAVIIIFLLSFVYLISPEHLTEFIPKVGDKLLSLIDDFDLYQLRYLAEDNIITIISYLLGTITGWMLTGRVIFIRGSKMPKRVAYEVKQTKKEPKGEEQKPPPQQEDRRGNYV